MGPKNGRLLDSDKKSPQATALKPWQISVPNSPNDLPVPVSGAFGDCRNRLMGNSCPNGCFFAGFSGAEFFKTARPFDHEAQAWPRSGLLWVLKLSDQLQRGLHERSGVAYDELPLGVMPPASGLIACSGNPA